MKNADTVDGISERLRAVMEEFDLGNVTMGELCGTSRSVVNNWVNDGNMPPVPKMVTLCQSKPISLDWIYTGKLATVDRKLINRLAKRSRAIRAKREGSPHEAQRPYLDPDD